jgi:hypothetical protein
MNRLPVMSPLCAVVLWGAGWQNQWQISTKFRKIRRISAQIGQKTGRAGGDVGKIDKSFLYLSIGY